MSRILKISAVLAGLGALAGAIGGCLFLALALIFYGRPEYPLSWLFAVVTGLGAGCGLLVAPVLSWTVLRDVPIWRCATETALATSFIGMWAMPLTNGEPWKIIAIAVLAAALAAARLKWAYRRRSAEPEVAA